MMHLTARIVCCRALTLALPGCSKFSMPEMPEMPNLKLGIPQLPKIHKFDVQQGNVITQDMIDQLKPGMTKSQVRFVMGTPLVADTFSQNRWDYYYSMVPAEGEEVRERIAIYFQNDLLVGLQGDFAPGKGSARPDEPVEAEDSVEDGSEEINTEGNYSEGNSPEGNKLEENNLDGNNLEETNPEANSHFDENSREAFSAQQNGITEDIRTVAA